MSDIERLDGAALDRHITGNWGEDPVPDDREHNDDGWMVDEDGTEYGWCNSCGEETETGTECCEDGEVVPYE